MNWNEFPIRGADPTLRITKRIECDLDKSVSTRSRTFKGRVGTCRTEHNSIPEPLHLCESFLNAAASAICCRHRGSPLSNQHQPPSRHTTSTRSRSSADKLLSRLQQPRLRFNQSTVSAKSLAKLGAIVKTNMWIIFRIIKDANEVRFTEKCWKRKHNVVKSP